MRIVATSCSWATRTAASWRMCASTSAPTLACAPWRTPIVFVWRRIARNARRLGRHLFPRHGLHLVLLGPDGAGKSTLAEILRGDLGPAFFGSRSRSFPPALLNGGDDYGAP